MDTVSLREITAENREAVLGLSVDEEQRGFVADNSKSLRQADEAPEAWLRAVFVKNIAVGLVLLHDEHLREFPREKGYYFLWRFMIDAAHQRKGYGRKAIDLVLDYVVTRPHARRLLSSYLPGDPGPEKFYQIYGFQPTGKIVEGEIEIEYLLPEQGGGFKR